MVPWDTAMLSTSAFREFEPHAFQEHVYRQRNRNSRDKQTLWWRGRRGRYRGRLFQGNLLKGIVISMGG